MGPLARSHARRSSGAEEWRQAAAARAGGIAQVPEAVQVLDLAKHPSLVYRRVQMSGWAEAGAYHDGGDAPAVGSAAAAGTGLALVEGDDDRPALLVPR